MQLLAPEILEQARGLSTGICVIGVTVGFLLWFSGWKLHRFWVVLATTVVAGIFGLLTPPAGRIPPLVMGLVLAVAAGVLALALVRVVAFAAGGFAACLVVNALAPVTWNEPHLTFLLGGLIGLLLFRVWVMTLTSLAGTLVMGYSSLCLADHLGKLDAVTLTGQRTGLLNIGCGALVLVGFVLQLLLERRRILKERQREEERARHQAEEELEELYRRRRWWQWGRRPTRRAG